MISILIISFVLEGLLSNFLPYMVQNITYFNPLFTLVSICLIYPFYQKDRKKYYLLAGLIGFLYDLFYTNLLFLNMYLFIITAFLVHCFYKKIRISKWTFPLLLICMITLYQGIYILLLVIFNVVPITLDNAIYWISHSYILNIVYGQILYLIIEHIPKKRRLN